MTLSVAIAHRFPGFSLDTAFVADRGITVLFGKSGSGKTTVVSAVAGLLRPNEGRVSVNGIDLLDTRKSVFVPAHRRCIGYVFQEGRLFPHLSVRQNLLYGNWFSTGNKGAFGKIVDVLGIGSLLDRPPGALSGGEKQRVAIGRALLSNPRLLLMDEPLAALDEARKAEILPYLEWVRDESRIPILYVTHSLAEVARLAETLVVLGDGKVIRSGPATDLLADPALATLFGLRDAGSILTARLVRHESDGLCLLETSGGQLLLPGIDAPPGAHLRVRLHAQDIILSRNRPEGLSALNILAAEVIQVRHGDGPGTMVQIRCGKDLLLARITRRSAEALGLTPGIAVFAIVKSVTVARGDIGKTAQE